MTASNSNHRWFALRVKSQKEKLVASALRSKGFEDFLPTHRCRRRWSDRVKQFEAPLFPGYVFCRFSLYNRLPILTTPWVLLIAGVGRTPLPVDDAEIAALQSIVKSGVDAEPWPFLQVGQRVSVAYGSLTGVEGILLGFKKPSRLIVSVSILQRSVAVEVDEGWVTPVSPSS